MEKLERGCARKNGFTLVELLAVVGVLVLILGVFATGEFSNAGKNRRLSAELVQSALANARTKALAKRRAYAFVWDREGVFPDDALRGKVFSVFELQENKSDETLTGDWLVGEQVMRWKALAKGVLFEKMINDSNQTSSPLVLECSYGSRRIPLDAIVIDRRGRIVGPAGNSDLRLVLVSGGIRNGSREITDFTDSGFPATASIAISRLTGLSDVKR